MPDNYNVVERIEAYLKRYLSFAEPSYTLPIALWTLGTYVWPEMDSFPYLVISSSTKRSGKTRLAELISFVCSNPVSSGAMTPAAIYKTMSEEKPTIFFDEAETLNSESASIMRSVLNMGYRRGQVIRRVKGSQVVEYEVYCPKAFILIGDVYDTLRDRSIIVRMRRGEPAERFVFEPVKAQGEELREEISAAIDEWHSEIINTYVNHKGIDFLTDRDEEIWTPLFVLCQILAPHRMKELEITTVDMATEKTQDSASYTELLKGEEKKAEQDEYSRKLLADMNMLMDSCGNGHIGTMELLEKLKAIPTSPWRKFQGMGITMYSLSYLLSPFGVNPKNVRVGQKVMKAYKKDDVKKALETF